MKVDKLNFYKSWPFGSTEQSLEAVAQPWHHSSEEIEDVPHSGQIPFGLTAFLWRRSHWGAPGSADELLLEIKPGFPAGWSIPLQHSPWIQLVGTAAPHLTVTGGCQNLAESLSQNSTCQIQKSHDFIYSTIIFPFFVFAQWIKLFWIGASMLLSLYLNIFPLSLVGVWKKKKNNKKPRSDLQHFIPFIISLKQRLSEGSLE